MITINISFIPQNLISLYNTHHDNNNNTMNMKTRHQAKKLTEEGAPPSPLQMYEEPKRCRRRPKQTQSTGTSSTGTSPDPNLETISTVPTEASLEAPEECTDDQPFPEASANTAIAAVRKLRSAKQKGKQSTAYADASSQTPPVVPQAPPHIHNMPSGNEIPYSKIHITVDSYPPPGSTLPQDELAFALPSALLYPILSYIAAHPTSRNTELKGILPDYLEAKSLRTVKVTRKVLDPVPYTNGKLVLGKKKEVTIEYENPYAEDEMPVSDSQPLLGLHTDPPSPVQEVQHPEVATLRQVQEEQVLEAAALSQAQEGQAPETPPTRGWNRFLPSTSSIAKFIPRPFTTRPTASATDAAIPPLHPLREELDFSRPNPHPITFAPRPHLQADAGAHAQIEQQSGSYDEDMNDHTDMDPNTQTQDNTVTHDNIDMDDAPAFPTTLKGPATRDQTEGTPQWAMVRGQAQKKRESKGKRKELRAQAEELREERARLQTAKAEFEEKRAAEEEMRKGEEARLQKAKEDFEAERAAHIRAQVPGEKRKRSPLQKTSNPQDTPNVFRLTYDYSSSEEGDDEDEQAFGEQETPSKSPHPAKRARVSGPENGAVVGDLHKAQPYTGHMFSLPRTPSTPYGHNFFGEGADGQHDCDGEESPAIVTKNTFKVPSPDDSDWESTGVYSSNQTTPTGKSPDAASNQSTFQTSPLALKQPQAYPAAGPSAEAPKFMAPPPRPNPSHASLPPTMSTPGPPAFVLDAVEKERQKALKHQPITGSRLRESSRLSISTVGSEAGDEPSPFGDEYDPKQPLILTSVSQDTLPDAVPWPGYVNSFEEFKKSTSVRVGAFVDTSFTVDDGKVAVDDFDEDLMADFDAIENNEDVARSGGVGQVDVEGPGTDMEGNGLRITSRVQDVIDASWTPGDDQAAQNQFDMGVASYYVAAAYGVAT